MDEMIKMTMLVVALLLGVVAQGCKDKQEVLESRELSDLQSIDLLPGKGAEGAYFGQTRNDVTNSLGSPFHENERMLSYSNLGIDIWLSRKDQTVVMITGGSLQSEGAAKMFKGKVAHSIQIGSSRKEIVASLGDPSANDHYVVEGVTNKDEILRYSHLNLTIRLRNEHAILFTLRGSQE